MSHFRVRPRIKFVVPLSIEEVLRRLEQECSQSDARVNAKILKGFAVLKIPPDRQHYWSPELSLDLESKDGETVIRGLFGPKPTVWTLFASFYGLAVFVGLIGLAFGLSQWSLGHDAWGFWAVPLSIGMYLSAYGIAFIGQRLGYSQMIRLRRCLEKVVEAKAMDP